MTPPAEPDAAAAARARRERLDRVFGDVLPETTRDERDPERAGDDGDDRLRREVPPHHGG